MGPCEILAGQGVASQVAGALCISDDCWHVCRPFWKAVVDGRVLKLEVLQFEGQGALACCIGTSGHAAGRLCCCRIIRQLSSIQASHQPVERLFGSAGA